MEGGGGKEGDVSASLAYCSGVFSPSSPHDLALFPLCRCLVLLVHTCSTHHARHSLTTGVPRALGLVLM